MTFDDGILTVYRASNVAAVGKKPDIRLTQQVQYYYHVEVIGITRYYQALQANAKVDALVSIQGWDSDIQHDDVIVLDNADGGQQFRVAVIQKWFDDRALKIRRLTLERLGENYDYATGQSTAGVN